MEARPLCLVIDDDPQMTAVLEEFLTKRGLAPRVYNSAAAAWEDLVSGETFDARQVRLIVTDLRMPGMDGLSFIERCHGRFPEIPVILMTAFGSIETAIEATKKGAFHYLTKPFRLDDLALMIDRALLVRRLAAQNAALRDEHRRAHGFAGLIGKSAAMQGVFDLIRKVSASSANVLIHGESGTGKELVARAIHQQGPRAAGPFVAINVTAIPDNLLESELFGHAKGSFTGATQSRRGLFEEAEGGTLFLDEIGDLDLALQAKLLRVLQDRKIRPVGDNKEKSINVRILTATHKDLKAAIRDGRFREDLYYRLSVIPVQIPPLRHRPEDIPILAHHFLDRFNAQNGTAVEGFESSALRRLMSLPWEGNVRELENVIERAVVLCDGPLLREEHLPTSDRETTDGLFSRLSEELPTLEGFEKRYIHFVLEKTGGKKEKAAQILGINRRTLYRKAKEWGWSSEDEPGDDAPMTQAD